MTQVEVDRGRGAARDERVAIIDADVHVGAVPSDPAWREHFLVHLPERWQTYMTRRPFSGGLDAMLIPSRPFSARMDAVPPGGGSPGSDPDFAREQLLDRFGISAAVLNGMGYVSLACGFSHPPQFSEAFLRASNEAMRHHWLPSDPRWRAVISVFPESPVAAAAEIARCAEIEDRFVGVYLPSRTEQPIGNPRYWPIFEAATEHGLPVIFHTSAAKTSHLTPSGVPGSYFEYHAGYAQHPYTIIPSLVFEGVFDRFPALKVGLIELGWSTLIPLARRMDGAWRVLRDEVPHLGRAPSEYVRDHIWFSTQPIDEPEDPAFLRDMISQLAAFGLGDRMLFSSDYPHWDFDAPDAVFRRGLLTEDERRRIMGANAATFFGIDVEGER